MKIEKYIEMFRPCEESQKFLCQFNTFDEAWAACDRGDWMLSAARLLCVDLHVLTLAKGLCANTVRHLMKDPRSAAAVDAAIAFGRSEITKEELDAAAYAAFAVYATAEAAYAAAAAYSATAAYAAAYATAYSAAAAYSATAAYAAAYAAAAPYAAEARIKNRQQTADICREVLTDAVMRKGKRGHR